MDTTLAASGPDDRIYDAIVIGAGPGGLQAAIYLGRYNRDVLLIDRGGGRTSHAHHIENVLTHRLISGMEIIRRGLEQAASFNVQIMTERVTRVEKDGLFSVSTAAAVYRSRSVIVSTGVSDIFPPIEHLYRFLGASYFTCIDCDGYRTTGKKLVVTGNSLNAVNLALAMKQLFTKDTTFIPYELSLPPSSAEVLADEGIPVIAGKKPVRIIGAKVMEGLELEDGANITCEAVMASFGVKMNDEFLSGLPLKRDAGNVHYVTSSVYESSLRGLYIVGPLNTGQDQVVIAAGEGATAAIDINKQLLEEKEGRGEVCSLAEHA